MWMTLYLHLKVFTLSLVSLLFGMSSSGKSLIILRRGLWSTHMSSFLDAELCRVVRSGKLLWEPILSRPMVPQIKKGTCSHKSLPEQTTLHNFAPRHRFAAPAAPRACNATRPVRVHRSLRSHLLYWNTTRDQSEGLFRGLTSNPKYTALSKVGNWGKIILHTFVPNWGGVVVVGGQKSLSRREPQGLLSIKTDSVCD